MISILPNLLSLVLWIKMWLIVVNFSLHFLEESIFPCCEMECFLNVSQVKLIDHAIQILSTLADLLPLDLSIPERGR